MEQGNRILMQGEEVERTIRRMAHEIIEKTGAAGDVALVGIRSRGAYLVRRIARDVEALCGAAPPVGVIDITPYRDDHASRDRGGDPPPARIPITVDEKTLILVDDVIYRGRTIRAALELVGRLGKPKKVLVAILVDRGKRELPIKADIVGRNVDVADSERVNVLLQESDGVDQVTVTGNPQP